MHTYIHTHAHDSTMSVPRRGASALCALGDARPIYMCASSPLNMPSSFKSSLIMLSLFLGVEWTSADTEDTHLFPQLRPEDRAEVTPEVLDEFRFAHVVGFQHSGIVRCRLHIIITYSMRRKEFRTQVATHMHANRWIHTIYVVSVGDFQCSVFFHLLDSFFTSLEILTYTHTHTHTRARCRQRTTAGLSLFLSLSYLTSISMRM